MREPDGTTRATGGAGETGGGGATAGAGATGGAGPGERPEARDPLAAPDWRRLNARMLLVHPIETLVRFLPALLVILIARAGSDESQRWELIALPVIVAFGVMRWLTTRYRVVDGQIELQRGLLTKQTTTARLDKVRTVDLTSKIYHRVLGLAKVEISTGGGRRDRLVLDSLLVSEGRRLRAELLHRVDPLLAGMPAPTGAPVAGVTAVAGVPGAAGVDESDVTPQADPDEVLLRLDPSWIRYAPLTTTGLATAAAGLGFLTQGFTRFGQESEAIVERARWVRDSPGGWTRFSSCSSSPASRSPPMCSRSGASA